MHDVAGGEVLSGILVEGLVELADELLEDRSHRGIVNCVRMELHLRITEPLHHEEQKTRLVELADRVVEVEVVQHVPACLG